MNNIYIIPGLGERCGLLRYKRLASALKNKGYRVVTVNPNWYRPLSEAVFPISKNDIVIGFSFGAIIAYLITKQTPAKKTIFASISPLKEFTFKSLVADYEEHMDRARAISISRDLKMIQVDLESLKSPYVTLAGEKEELKAQITVPKAAHKITPEYIKEIAKLI